MHVRFHRSGLDLSRLEAVFLTHLHADHVGDLSGMLLYGSGARVRDNWPLAPVWSPARSRSTTADYGGGFERGRSMAA